MTQLHDHNPPAPLSRRRFSVGLAYGAWLVALLAFVCLLLSGQLWWKALQGGAALVALLGAFLLKAAAAGLPRMQDPDLDERQRLRLTEAYALAHRLTVSVLGGVFAAVIAADVFDLKVTWPNMSVQSSLLTSGWVLLLLLPTAILAWTEPDLSDE